MKRRLVVTGTLLQQKNIHENTRIFPDYNTNKQTDNILVTGKYRKSILETNSRRGTDLGSDLQFGDQQNPTEDENDQQVE
mgnify:FL=1